MITQPPTLPITDEISEDYEDITVPITTITQPPTEAITEKLTQPKEKETQPSTQPATQLLTQPPIIYYYIQPNQPDIITPEQPQIPNNIEPAPTPSYDDIALSQSTINLKPGETTTIYIIYPAGLATQGSDWSLDNQAIVSFVSSDVDSVVIQAKGVGSTIVYAKPKGTGITLPCTVIVSN